MSEEKRINEEKGINEEKRINEVIERHKQFFETTPYDVARSTKGKYYFYFVELSGDLFSFREFETAEELECMILHETADCLNAVLELSMESINASINEREISYSACDYGSAVKRLANSLEIIRKESEKWRDTVCNSIESLLAHLDNKPE